MKYKTYIVQIFMPFESKNLRGMVNAGPGYLRYNAYAKVWVRSLDRYNVGNYYMSQGKLIVKVIPLKGFNHSNNSVKRLATRINRRFSHYWN